MFGFSDPINQGHSFLMKEVLSSTFISFSFLCGRLQKLSANFINLLPIEICPDWCNNSANGICNYLITVAELRFSEY